MAQLPSGAGDQQGCHHRPLCGTRLPRPTLRPVRAGEPGQLPRLRGESRPPVLIMAFAYGFIGVLPRHADWKPMINTRGRAGPAGDRGAAGAGRTCGGWGPRTAGRGGPGRDRERSDRGCTPCGTRSIPGSPVREGSADTLGDALSGQPEVGAERLQPDHTSSVPPAQPGRAYVRRGHGWLPPSIRAPAQGNPVEGHGGTGRVRRRPPPRCRLHPPHLARYRSARRRSSMSPTSAASIPRTATCARPPLLRHPRRRLRRPGSTPTPPDSPYRRWTGPSEPSPRRTSPPGSHRPAHRPAHRTAGA